MVKKIISNTILFIVIIIFVKAYSAIFGNENTLLGVTILIELLVLLQEDLIGKKLYNFILLLLLNVFICIISFLASRFIGIAPLINFFAMMLIGYLLSFKMDKILIVPFGLEYLFMYFSPVDNNGFILRIIGVIIGTFIIMLSQFIIHKIKNLDKKSDFLLIDIKYNKRRFFYALRLGLIIALTTFFINYFKLEQGRWIVYTVFSVTEIYSTHCKIRSFERLSGTIIGSIIALLLGFLIKDPNIIVLLVMSAGFFDSFTKTYKQKIICVTVSVVLSVSLINGTIRTSLERVVYIIIGILIALLFDKIINEKLYKINTR